MERQIMSSSLDNRSNELSRDLDGGHTAKVLTNNSFKNDFEIVIIESAAFLRDCILRSVRSFTSREVATFKSLNELRDYRPGH